MLTIFTPFCCVEIIKLQGHRVRPTHCSCFCGVWQGWWSILCVNLTRNWGWGAQISGQTFSECLWQCFPMRWTFGSQIECSRSPSPVWVGIIWSVEGMNRIRRLNHLKICMETKKTPNSQSSLEGEKRSWRNQTTWLQTILQSYSKQDNMALAQKQKHRSMEQDRKARDKPTHLWSTNVWQRRQRYTMEKRQSLQ